MTLRENQSLFVELIAELIIHAYKQGFEMTFGDAWAKTGHRHNSNHYIRLAIDLNLFKDGVWLQRTVDHLELGNYWESLNPLCCWGGRWNDGNHYSLSHEGRK